MDEHPRHAPDPDRPGPDQLVALLASERAITENRLADLHGDFRGMVAASADSNADDEHDPEGSTIAFERSQLGALIAQAQQQLDEIDAACVRVAEGRYGSCETCRGPIAPARLVARPVARNCIDCAGRATAR
ncbi:MAG TPA: TraR/DksA family transcriptional regulator [Nocardioidaceae bacterium]|nr:TraR/DksA family transcriptional regulator [Nocardioidaceae bacterium]